MDDGQQSNSSRSMNKNVSFDDLQSFEKSLITSKPNPYFLCKLLSAKVFRNLRYSFDRLNSKALQHKMKIKIVNKIEAKTNKILFKLKMQAFQKIKEQKYRQNLRKQGLVILHNCSLGINKKMKTDALLRLYRITQSGLMHQNARLKAIESKFNQNYISLQHHKVFQKFLKISPKNLKLFLKSSQQILSPQLLILSSQLQSQRINKNAPSTSQLLLNTLKNYIASYEELNGKLTQSQTQLKQANDEKNHILAQARQWRKANQNKENQFRKFDQQLKQKQQAMIQSGYNIGYLKSLERVIQYQSRLCQGKKQSYQYNSRKMLLKLTLLILRKFLSNFQSSDKSNISQSSTQILSSLSASRSQPHSLFNPSNQTIQQQNSLQQSDIIQQITLIIGELLQLMQTQTTIQSFRYCGNKKNFINSLKERNRNKGRNKNLMIPELTQVGQKCQQIFQKYCQKLFKCWQLQSQNNQLNQQYTSQIIKLTQEIQSKNKQILNISQKFKQINQQLLQNSQKFNSLSHNLQILTTQNSRIKLQLENKTKQLSKVQEKNKEKSTKIYKMGEQYRRFKNILDMDFQKSRNQRQKSIQAIVEKSLSQSRQKINKNVYDKLKNIKPITNINSRNVLSAFPAQPKISKLIQRHEKEPRTPKKQPKYQTKMYALNKTIKSTQNNQLK